MKCRVDGLEMVAAKSVAIVEGEERVEDDGGAKLVSFGKGKCGR